MGNNIRMRGKLEAVGFHFGQRSVHSSRTIMLEDLTSLLDHVGSDGASLDDYFRAVVQENCLRKRSEKNRLLTYQHLIHLYSLDVSLPVFRALLYYWRRDEKSRQWIALLCAYVRDPLLRLSASIIREQLPGACISSQVFEELVEKNNPNRFSPSTLASTGRNIRSSWSKAGYFIGKNGKERQTIRPGTGAICYAIFLGYLSGIRGDELMKSEYVRILDCSFEQALENARLASQRGWLNLKNIGKIVEVMFPQFTNGLSSGDGYE